MSRAGAGLVLPGERVLWEGRPDWRALARDMMHVRLVALYWAVVLIWHLADDRMSGYGPGDTVLGALPLLAFALVVLAACLGFAAAVARTTTYTITTERCVLRFGIALQATLSVPLRRVASVSVWFAGDGTGCIPLALKPGRKIGFLKLWPHARAWHLGRPQPMLRGVPEAGEVALLLARAVADVSPGRLETVPLRVSAPGLVPGRVASGVV